MPAQTQVRRAQGRVGQAFGSHVREDARDDRRGSWKDTHGTAVVGSVRRDALVCHRRRQHVHDNRRRNALPAAPVRGIGGLAVQQMVVGMRVRRSDHDAAGNLALHRGGVPDHGGHGRFAPGGGFGFENLRREGAAVGIRRVFPYVAAARRRRRGARGKRREEAARPARGEVRRGRRGYASRGHR